MIGVIDQNYNVVAKYTYDSWGNLISITDGNGNSILYYFIISVLKCKLKM
ncbi:MAG TPA: RHS repeat protein [Clostridiaceae bacterium]|nr:RHS repeat protein [Clostridiaceae bacterium]